MEITGKTSLTALLGDPVSHSVSPKMHNLSFEALGIDCVYLALETKEEDLSAVAHALKAIGSPGYNVTMPYKEQIIPLLDELTDVARFSESCNTVILKDGRAVGHTTDGEGFMRSVAENDCAIIGKKITLLGAGGVAKAILAQAAVDGVAAIDVFRRMQASEDTDSETRAARITAYAGSVALTQRIAAETGCVISVHDLADTGALRTSLAQSAMLVNATSVGMEPDTDASLITDPALLPPSLFVYDVIYHPRETKLLRVAREAGCRTANGEDMLLYQGAAAFQCWTGQEMPIDLVRQQVFSS